MAVSSVRLSSQQILWSAMCGVSLGFLYPNLYLELLTVSEVFRFQGFLKVHKLTKMFPFNRNLNILKCQRYSLYNYKSFNDIFIPFEDYLRCLFLSGNGHSLFWFWMEKSVQLSSILGPSFWHLLRLNISKYQLSFHLNALLKRINFDINYLLIQHLITGHLVTFGNNFYHSIWITLAWWVISDELHSTKF